MGRRSKPFWLITVALLLLSTLAAGPVAAQPWRDAAPVQTAGAVLGPLTTAWPPPPPTGPAPAGVDPTAWQTLKKRWNKKGYKEPENIYRRAFFRAYPNLIGKVVLHHAIEKQVLDKGNPYHGMFTAQEIHGVANLRPIPMGRVNNQMHNSRIRKLWNDFYRRHPAGKVTKADFYAWRDRIDVQLRAFFLNQASAYSATQAQQRYKAVKALGEAAFNRDQEKIDTFPGFTCAQGKTACGSTGANASGLTNAIATAASRPGGIDFSSLELRYLSDAPAADGRHAIGYAFTGEPASRGDVQGLDAGMANIESASDAFFVWLSLPRDRFTVNLNPNEPDRIVDADFGRTEAGRVLLESDLLLKKTVAHLIHPDTARGKAFWSGLQGTQKCISLRQWIVPAPATVRVTGDELFILAAPLQVKMETEYLKDRGNGHYDGCPKQPHAIDVKNEALYRRMILPSVVRAVNHSSEYAALRRVYLSRIAAEWIRDRYQVQRKHTDFDDLIDSGDIDRWAPHQSWTPRDTYNRYLRSYTKGEFKVTRKSRRGRYVYTDTYVVGGVDFTTVPRHAIGAAEFASRWPDLAHMVRTAQTRAVTASGSHQIWLGGRSTAKAPPGASGLSPPPGQPTKPAAGSSPLRSVLLGVGLLLLIGSGSVVKRLRRRRT